MRGKTAILAAILVMVGCATTNTTRLDSGYFLIQTKALMDLIRVVEETSPKSEENQDAIMYATAEIETAWEHFVSKQYGDEELDRELVEHINDTIHYLNRVEPKSKHITDLLDRAETLAKEMIVRLDSRGK